MQFSLITLLALPLLATAGPIDKRETQLVVQAEKPNFYHGEQGSVGNCSKRDYKRCVTMIKDPIYSFKAAPKKQWYQCWAGTDGATCFVWDGAF